ncbi:RNA-directed DNA polymerase [Ectothiorhodospira haloalkaliphila]|uniref:RNA-directed DNA polymerase n=1 Tax=Ectothiorhodospira haloalkaliphila TaxID=421628 RepID=UPI000AD3812F|nr:reverse transcriptase domain-containing protein [Ectothiorhodospira haloalkaliphila]
MATTTGTTRATTTGSGWCAAESEAAGIFSLRELWQAYEACRRRKRGTRDAQRYDQHLLNHLVDTRQALATRQWRPHPSTWFVTLRPKAREVHCAPFADRVVHHWLVPRLETAFEPVFIHDSHSNRVGHGVLHAVERLQGHLRRASANGKRPACYLQLDIANFFNTVNRRHLYRMIRHRLRRQAENNRMAWREAEALLWLTGRILAQEPAEAAIYKGVPSRKERVPRHKRLSLVPDGFGLAIGNLPSQLFANIYLNELDQFVKHQLRCRGYVRYVDDLVLVHQHDRQLAQWRTDISAFLDASLGLQLRDAGRIDSVYRGVDFLGYIVRPGYRLVRNRVIQHLDERLYPAGRGLVQVTGSGVTLDLPKAPREALRATLASYLGHGRHAAAWRLFQRVFQRHPWLNLLFTVHDDLRLKPRWQPPAVSGLRGQWRWFIRQWPGALVLVQTGHRFEVYNHQAEDIAQRLHTPLDTVPRRAFASTLSRPLKHLKGLRRHLRRQGVPHLFVAEEGHLPGGLKRRVLRLAWWPCQPPLPPWGKTQGL